MSDPLPVAHVGLPTKDSPALNDAVQEIIARLNEVPDHLTGQVLCSVVATVCCNQTDPVALFEAIGTHVAQAIAAFLLTPQGNG